MNNNIKIAGTLLTMLGLSTSAGFCAPDTGNGAGLTVKETSSPARLSNLDLFQKTGNFKKGLYGSCCHNKDIEID